jgi:hypothetical protein
MLAWTSLICAIYIGVECFIAFYKMDRGDRFCRFAKYVAALVSSAIVIYYSLHAPQKITIEVLVFLITIYLFIWPVMLYRFRGNYRNRIGDK